jgi:glucose-6-phosphate-specific signal transduction histidine kinase
VASNVRRRTLPITILAIVAVVAGVYAVFDLLRFLSILPAAQVGEMSFYNFSWLGALLAGILALIWFSTAAQLWRLDPRGWLFVVLVATLNLIFLVMAWIGRSSWQAVSAGIIINGVALILGLLPSTKAAFGMPVTQQKR